MSQSHKPSDEERRHFLSILQGFKDGMLVTHGTREGLHARPMHIARHDEDGTVWLMSDVKSGKIDELSEDARVALTLQGGGRYLSLNGHAEVMREPKLVSQMWNEAWRVWFPKGPEDPSIALLKLVPHHGEYWDAGGLSGIAYIFEAARAYVKGTTPKLGHDTQAKVKL